MKLATLADGSRDGHLVVVADDLDQAHYACAGASRLQALLDDWNFLSPQLEDISATLAGGKARHAMPFDPTLVRAPLPRPPRCVRLVLHREGDQALAGTPCAVVEEPAWFGGPRWPGEPAATAQWHWQPHLALVTADLPWGADPARAAEAVRLMGWAVRPLLAGIVTGLGAGEASLQDRAGVASASASAWRFAPLLATPSTLPASAEGWNWRRLPVGADGPIRLPRGSSSLAGAAGWPAANALGPALAAVAQRAPLPAGTVVLLPLAEPEAHPTLPAGAIGWSLALVDATGAAPLGEVVFTERQTRAAGAV